MQDRPLEEEETCKGPFIGSLCILMLVAGLISCRDRTGTRMQPTVGFSFSLGGQHYIATICLCQNAQADCRSLPVGSLLHVSGYQIDGQIDSCSIGRLVQRVALALAPAHIRWRAAILLMFSIDCPRADGVCPPGRQRRKKDREHGRGTQLFYAVSICEQSPASSNRGPIHCQAGCCFPCSPCNVESRFKVPLSTCRLLLQNGSITEAVVSHTGV